MEASTVEVTYNIVNYMSPMTASKEPPSFPAMQNHVGI
jgi:hypothetical protein